MPEYLSPGVYVVEVDATPNPIQGVSTSTIDLVISAIVQDVRKQLGTVAPDWTEHNSTDPVVTLLELFAWLAEQTIFRANKIPDRAVAPAARLTALLLAALADKKADPLKAVHFYPGRHHGDFAPRVGCK
jgi:phage tail sheath protein FI